MVPIGNDLVCLDRLRFKFLLSFLACQEVLYLPDLLLGQIICQHCVLTSEGDRSYKIFAYIGEHDAQEGGYSSVIAGLVQHRL